MTGASKGNGCEQQLLIAQIIIQGYICDECGHDWEAIKQLEDWHGKYD